MITGNVVVLICSIALMGIHEFSYRETQKYSNELAAREEVVSASRYIEFFVIYALLIGLLQFINDMFSIHPTATNSLVALIISVFLVFTKNKIAKGFDISKIYLFGFASIAYLLCSVSISYLFDKQGITIIEGIIIIVPFISLTLLSKFKLL